ncbi:hypothetical protein B0H13DRAFT_1850588 [Mycena leptocephala]|nr:hypothetical protein B0H13DRAFT_1850588 [Mycena leptocephala]
MKIASAADESALRPTSPFSTLPTRSHPSVASQTASYSVSYVYLGTQAQLRTKSGSRERLSTTTVGSEQFRVSRLLPPLPPAKRVPGLARIKPPGASTWPPSERTRPVALTVLRFA